MASILSRRGEEKMEGIKTIVGSGDGEVWDIWRFGEVREKGWTVYPSGHEHSHNCSRLVRILLVPEQSHIDTAHIVLPISCRP
jgi:hypothetical protein